MSSVGHFPVRFTDIDECPEPFRDPLKSAINATDNIYDIIYSPAFVSGRSSVPGSVFCVTDRDGVLDFFDTRPCAPVRRARIDGLARKIYLACDTSNSEAEIIKRFSGSAQPAAIVALLNELTARKLLL